jgi:hypothetical protein
MQPVHITTNVVSSHPTQEMCTRYNIIVSDLRQNWLQTSNKLCNNFEQDYYINTLNVKTCLSYNFKPQSGQIKDYKAVLLGIKIMCPSRGVSVVVFNATFNNISVTLWWSVLLREEKRKPVLTQVTDNNVVSSTHFLSGMRYIIVLFKVVT